MRFIFVEFSERAGERRRALLPDRRYVIGRSTAADWPCPDDRRMSSQHFRLSFSAGHWQIEDLNSTNGTQLNGNPIKAMTPLHAGDQIIAGNSRFQLQTDAMPTGTGPVERLPTGSIPKVTAAVPLQKTTKSMPAVGRILCSKEKCESGLQLYHTPLEALGQVPPVQVAQRLAEVSSLYLILDLAKLGHPQWPGLEFASPLFTWMPPEIAKTAVVAVPPGVLNDLPPLFDAAWDKDAAICLFADGSPEIVLSHLQRAVRFNADGHPSGPKDLQGILGYCWPSVLAQLLHFRTPDFVGRLMHGIRAAMVEMSDLPGAWQIFSSSDFGGSLQQAGFTPQ